MSIRITCPGCDTVHSVSDEKSGKRVKCKDCGKPISVPDHREGIQESRNVKAKTKLGTRSPKDDDDDRPAKKAVKKPKKGGAPVLLIIGGLTVAALLLCVVGGVGGVVYAFFWVKQGAQDLTKDVADAANKQIAEIEKLQKDIENKKFDPFPPDRPKVDPFPKIDPKQKTDPAPKPKTDPEPKFDPTPKPKTDPEPKTDPTAKPKTDPEPKTDPAPKPKNDPEPKVDPTPKTEPSLVASSRISEAYMESNQTRLPVKFTLSDPLNRVKEVRVEIWTGTPGQPRPMGMIQPAPMPGDGPRTAFKLPYQAGVSSGDLVIPTLPPGQVLWVQPVLVTATGSQWGAATPVSIGSALLQRSPAILTNNLVAVKDRTVKLSSTWTETTGKAKNVSSEKVEADILESLTSTPPAGASLKTAYGKTELFDAQNIPRDAQVITAFKQIPPIFVMDAAGALKDRTERKLGPPTPVGTRNQAMDGYWHLHTALEAAAVPVPNKTVLPLESWQAVVPITLKRKKKSDDFDLVMTCTYEGMRVANKRDEAVISVNGHLRGRGATLDKGVSSVAGKFGFDLAGGFISFAQLQVNSEYDSFGPVTNALRIDLTRIAGNPLNIQPGTDVVKNDPKNDPKKDPKANPNGKTIYDQQLFLTAGDFPDPTQKITQPKLDKFGKLPPGYKPPTYNRLKPIQLPQPLQMGKKYTISLTTQNFNSSLRLESAFGQPLAQASNPVGNNSQLVYTAQQQGLVRIICGCRDGKLGQFHLTVTEQ